MRKSIAITAASALLAAGGMAVATNSHADEPEIPNNAKVWVCKFAGTPGEDEKLQTLIHVNWSAITSQAPDAEYKVGAPFADEHGRSVVIALHDDPAPTEADCDDYLTPDPGEPEPTGEPTTDPTTDPTEEPTTDPTEEPTTDPTEEPTTDPTDDPTTDPTDDPTGDPGDDDSDDPAEKPEPEKPGVPSDDDSRGVPADTGGEGDLTAIALLGTIGLAASGGMLAAARRRN